MPETNRFAAGYGALIYFDQLVKSFLPRTEPALSDALGAFASLGSKNAGATAAGPSLAARARNHGTLGSALSRLMPRALGGAGSSGWLSLGWIFGGLALMFFLAFVVLGRKARNLRAVH